MDTIIVQEKQQEAFNKVWNHFVVNNGKPSINGSTCMYRQDQTPTCAVKCAVGLLIPDEEYHPEFDSRGDNSIYIIFKKLPTLQQYGLDFLSSLQIVHDRVNQQWNDENRAEWFEVGFRKVADTYFLTIPND